MALPTGNETHNQTATVKEWLTSLIGSSPYGIMAFDLAGICTLANDTAGKAFGVSERDLVDQNLEALIAHWPAFGVVRGNWTADGRNNFDHERVERGDFVYRVRGRAIVDGMIITLDDVSDEVRIRSQQDALVAQLESANRELAEFAYICAHDMKSPVANLVGVVDDIFESFEIPDEMLAPLNMVHRSVLQLDKNVKSLNHILRVRRSVAEEHRTSDLGLVMQEVSESLESPLAEAAATVSIDISGTYALPLAVEQLRSVLQNLMTNAINYRSPDRRLEIDVRAVGEAGAVVLRFSDNGQGFDAERFGSKVFGLFNRLQPDGDGSGIGLYLVKSIVQSCGGSVAVQSSVGAGAVFTLRIPYDT